MIRFTVSISIFELANFRFIFALEVHEDGRGGPLQVACFSAQDHSLQPHGLHLLLPSDLLRLALHERHLPRGESQSILLEQSIARYASCRNQMSGVQQKLIEVQVPPSNHCRCRSKSWWRFRDNSTSSNVVQSCSVSTSALT